MVFDVEFLLSPETSSNNHFYCFQFPLDNFPIFVSLALSSFDELFSWFHCDIFWGYFSWCYPLHCRFSVSSAVVVWIAEQFRHLHGSDILVSFLERLVLCRLLLGRYLSTCYHWCLAGYITSHLVHSCIDQQRLRKLKGWLSQKCELQFFCLSKCAHMTTTPGQLAWGIWI